MTRCHGKEGESGMNNMHDKIWNTRCLKTFSGRVKARPIGLQPRRNRYGDIDIIYLI